ncbi:MAG: GntR family transcriptional regulator [Candidatus Accumulibacter sp.]|nr:GntR family transcriptional regulator [Accumulibacter sp.]
MKEKVAESQAEKAYQLLEEMIVTLQIKPGTKISEKRLCETLGLGRTPIREALQRLANECAVTIEPRHGVVVSPIDVLDQFHLIEVRRALELILVRRATRLASDEDRAQFADFAAQFHQAGETLDEKLLASTERDFRGLLAVTARNKYVLLAMRPFQAQTRRFQHLYFKRFGDLAHLCELHSQIARAVADADEARAKATLHTMMDYIEEYTEKTMRAIY